MKIRLDKNDRKLETAIRREMDTLVINDPNLNGLEYTIAHDDYFTCIEGVDELIGMQIMTVVNRVREETR